MGALLVNPINAGAQALPVTVPDGLDAIAYGEAAGYPVAPPHGNANRRPVMVGSYSHYDAIYPAHVAAASSTPSVLRHAPQELVLSYRYAGQNHTLADYLTHNPATGLLVARGDAILFEHYQYGRTEHSPLLSQSMANTSLPYSSALLWPMTPPTWFDDPVAAYALRLVGNIHPIRYPDGEYCAARSAKSPIVY